MTALNVKPHPPRLDLTQAGALPASAAVSAWAEWVRFAVVAAEFGLLVLVIRLFELESGRFGDLAVLAWVGFIVHHLLPSRLRMPFFVILSLAGLKLVAGGTIAVCVTGAGLVLIAFCHLPVPFVLRVGLLLLAGVLLACLRAGWLATPVHPAAWMILGSMFMFRLIIYLYDMRHQAAPVGPIRAMAYFFMLPNVCFPFFPVVDYKTFCATYFNEPALRTYQSGLRWILRGVIHLLLYRVVYQIVMIDPLEVTDLGGTARVAVGIYLLYLRISGQFHVIVGLLHLFGFNLPETHHLYYLAGNFTDLWRRINIYWKDFIMKVFFYPAYFRMKGLGPLWATVIGTLVAFFATWLLHAYAWFWIRGTILFTWQEAVFWWLLAMLLLANLLYEARHGRERALGKPRRMIWSELGRALRTVAVFVVMCLLWTAWSSHSGEELAWLAKSATRITPASAALVLLGLVVVGVASVVFGHSAAESTVGSKRLVRRDESKPAFSWRMALSTGLASCGLLLVSAIPESALDGTPFGELHAAISRDQLNQMDADALRRGYYEGLDVTRLDENLAFLRNSAPRGWDAGADQFERKTGDLLITQLIPGTGPVEFHGKPVTINRWGMRDRDYEKGKPPGVYRVALLGSSFEFGSGVADNETFENLVEDRLNAEGGRPRYEVLNFAEPGYSALQYLAALEQRALNFEPDAVFLVVNANEIARSREHGAKVLHSGFDIPYDILSKVARDAGIQKEMSEAMIRARVGPFAREIVAWAYGRIAEHCRLRGICLYMVYRPSVIAWSKKAAEREADVRHQLFELAEELNLSVLDLTATFDGVKNRRDLMVAPWDEHANAKGHRMLADELFKKLHDPGGKIILRPRTEIDPR